MVQASAPERPAPPASPHRRRVERVRRTERRPAASEPWAGILFVPPQTLLVLFLVSLVVPVGFSIAGLQLTPYNSMLIVFMIPAFLYWLQHAPRVVMLDVFMLLYIFWIAVAIYHNHGMSRMVFILNQSVTLFGAYLLGRVLVRSPADYRLMFVCLVWILLVLFPFGLVELLLRRSVFAMIFGHGQIPGDTSGGGIRLGMRRVSTVFPHPILFGVFCSIMVSNFFYVFYRKGEGRGWKTALAVTMTFMSLSTGPLLAQAGQLMLIAWERLFRIFVTKWAVLVVTAATFLGVFQLSYPDGIYGFVVAHLAFNSQTAMGRMEILVYGSQTVAQNPVFGIGLTPWNGPWWRPVSVDNFWMVTAMRYGLPALGLFWAGLAWHAVRIISRGGLSEASASYRKGYVFAAAGMVFALAAVHVWGSVAVFVMFYIGAGAWLYDGAAALAPVEPPERSRGQASPAATARGARPPRRTTARQGLSR